MKMKLTSLMIALCISMATTACGKTYTGKIIDADTKEPIEGAVVVASWLEETTTVSATHTRLKDVKEALTDKNGEWVVEGPRGSEGGNITVIFSLLTGTYYTLPPEFIIFKPGYCSWPKGLLIEACRKKIKYKGNGDFAGWALELPKLIKREDRLMALPTCFSGDTKDRDQIIRKQKKFISLINEESRTLGISEYKVLEEVSK